MKKWWVKVVSLFEITSNRVAYLQEENRLPPFDAPAAVLENVERQWALDVYPRYAGAWHHIHEITDSYSLEDVPQEQGTTLRDAVLLTDDGARVRHSRIHYTYPS